MPKAQLVIKSATHLTHLGIKSEPNPYLIVQCEENQSTTGIIKHTINPQWDHKCSIIGARLTSSVRFYIYNNNSNHIDELIGYAELELGQLMTRVLTDKRIRLVNAMGNILESFLQIEHCNSQPEDINLMYTAETSIILMLVGDLPVHSELIVNYGEMGFSMKGHSLTQHTINYTFGSEKIGFTLSIINGQRQQRMKQNVLIQNIEDCTFFRLRFDSIYQEYLVNICCRIVQKGVLPENFNILNVSLIDCSKNGKALDDLQIKVYGPLNSSSILKNKLYNRCQIYIENSSVIMLEFYEQKEPIDTLEPTHSRSLSINSRNWSSDRSCIQIIVYSDTLSNSETNIKLKLFLTKTIEQSAIIPKLNTSTLFTSDESPIQIQQLKFINCYLSQIMAVDTMLNLYHIGLDGSVTYFNPFQVKQSAEYVINCKVVLKNGGRGSLVLSTHQIPFAEKMRTLDNYCILKIIYDKSNLNEGVVDYTKHFLSFAKKVSLVSKCKKFNQMVQDCTLNIVAKCKKVGSFHSGTLNIINSRVQGVCSDVYVGIVADENELTMQGQVGNYLLKKNHQMYLSNSRIKLKFKIGEIERQVYGHFQDLFGEPEMLKMYCFEYPITGDHKFMMVYQYSNEGESSAAIDRDEKICFTNEDTVVMQVTSALVDNPQRSYCLQATREKQFFSSTVYTPSTNIIHFDSEEPICFKGNQKQHDNYIFFTMHSQYEGKLNMYNGCICIRSIVGRGEYQVALVHQGEEKLQRIMLTVKVLSKKLPLVENVKLIADRIVCGKILREIYKYYLAVKVNSELWDVVEATYAGNQLRFNVELRLQCEDCVDWALYSTYKVISKELFETSEKEIVANGKQSWENILDKKQLFLKFNPGKDLQMKLTKNTLMYLQKKTEFVLNYRQEAFKTEIKKQSVETPKQSLFITSDVDVLSAGAVLLDFKKVTMCYCEAKIIEMLILPLGLKLCCQSTTSINNLFLVQANNMSFTLRARITVKDNEKFRNLEAEGKVNLKNRRIKLHKQAQLTIKFDSLCKITANATVLSNKFVLHPKGVLKVSKVTVLDSQFDQISISFMQNFNYPNQIASVQKLNDKKIISFQTDSCLNALLLTFERKGVKIKKKILVAEEMIDRVDEDINWLKKIRVKNEVFTIAMNLTYSPEKAQQMSSNELVYAVQQSNDEIFKISVVYDIHYFANFRPNVSQVKPDRVKGFKLLVKLPDSLKDIKKVGVIDEKNQILTITQQGLLPGTCFSFIKSEIRVSQIKFLQSKYTKSIIQNLGRVNGVQKFIIDQNPKLICTVSQIPYDLSRSNTEGLVLNVDVHQIFSKNAKKRLFSLINSPNDEILTTKFALLLKHNSQTFAVYNIDLQGKLSKQSVSRHTFGYDSASDQIEVYLFIQNIFNEQWSVFDNLNLQNWTAFMPVAQGVISLQHVNIFEIGCTLQPFINVNQTMDCAVSKLIKIQGDLNLLGSIEFQKGRWGYIELILIKHSPIVFNEKKQNVFLFYVLSIETGNRIQLKSLTTEPRDIQPNVDLFFTQNALKLLLIDMNTSQTYSLKIQGFLIQKGISQIFCQKRHDITQYLSRRGTFDLSLQIKSADCKNICATYKIFFRLTNSSCPPSKTNLIIQSQSINTHDIISFKQQSSQSMLFKLLGCDHTTHFYECLQQIHQSFIYNQDMQTELLCYLTGYLSYRCNQRIVKLVAEIMQMSLLKEHKLVKVIEERNLIGLIYQDIKTICVAKKEDVPHTVENIDWQSYQKSILKFQKQKTIASFRILTIKQYEMLHTSKERFEQVSQVNSQLLLNVIILLLKHSQTIQEFITRDLEEWIEVFAFRQKKDFEIFVVFLQTAIVYRVEMSQKIVSHFVEVLIHRLESLDIVFQFWMNIDSQQTKEEFFITIISKYTQEISTKAAQSCKGLKMMLFELTKRQAKVSLLDRQQYQKLSSILLSNLFLQKQLFGMSNYIDLLILLHQKHLLSEEHEKVLLKFLQGQQQTAVDDQVKVILGNFITKIVRKVPQGNSQRSATNSQQVKLKSRTFRKYLLTND